MRQNEIITKASVEGKIYGLRTQPQSSSILIGLREE
jgi:hypothetical protein